MSMITENTIIIKTENYDLFLKDVESFGTERRISNIETVYKSSDYMVIVFDCNGDVPWEIDNTECPYEVLETNYLTGEDDAIVTFSDENDDIRCSDLLDKYVEKSEINRVKNCIEYSIM